MGAYILVTSPEYITEVYAKFSDGARKLIKVSVYRYAYKPSYSWDKFNQKMEFKYVWPCRNAFSRAGKRPEIYGIWDSDWKPGMALSDNINNVFLTSGHVALNDESLGGAHFPYVALEAEAEYIANREPDIPREQLKMVFA
jgi:hypothetical protein